MVWTNIDRDIFSKIGLKFSLNIRKGPKKNQPILSYLICLHTLTHTHMHIAHMHRKTAFEFTLNSFHHLFFNVLTITQKSIIQDWIENRKVSHFLHFKWTDLWTRAYKKWFDSNEHRETRWHRFSFFVFFFFHFFLSCFLIKINWMCQFSFPSWKNT